MNDKALKLPQSNGVWVQRRNNHLRWLNRKTPSIDEWGDIHDWIDGEPVDYEDDVSRNQADIEAWRTVGDDYEESLYGYEREFEDVLDEAEELERQERYTVENHDLDCDDYDLYHDDYGYDPIVDEHGWQSYYTQVYEEDQAYEDNRPYTDAWIKKDDVEWCWRVHEEQTGREISDYYEREDQMTDAEIDAEWNEIYREAVAWDPHHYLFGMHPLTPKR